MNYARCQGHKQAAVCYPPFCLFCEEMGHLSHLSNHFPFIACQRVTQTKNDNLGDTGKKLMRNYERVCVSGTRDFGD